MKTSLPVKRLGLGLFRTLLLLFRFLWLLRCLLNRFIFSFLFFCFHFACDFFNWFWWRCRCHCPAYPCTDAHYGDECNEYWNGDYPELNAACVFEIEVAEPLGIEQCDDVEESSDCANDEDYSTYSLIFTDH